MANGPLRRPANCPLRRRANSPCIQVIRISQATRNTDCLMLRIMGFQIMG
jgi:hypothetical protein